MINSIGDEILVVGSSNGDSGILNVTKAKDTVKRDFVPEIIIHVYWNVLGTTACETTPTFVPRSREIEVAEAIEWSKKFHREWKERMKKKYNLKDMTPEELKEFDENTTKKISEGLSKQFKNAEEAIRSLRFR